MGNLNEKAQLHGSFRPCRDILLALALIFGLSTYLYGVRVLIIAAVSTVTALLCDLLAAALRPHTHRASDISSYAFALTLAAMLPATVPYTTVIYSTAAAVLLGKHAFGGWDGLVFHPAALGYAIAAVCNPTGVTSYPKPFSSIGLGFNVGDVQLYDGILKTLRLGAVPDTDIVDLALGNYAAPLGSAFGLVCAACLVLFVAHRDITWHTPVAFLAVCAAWSLISPRLSLTRLASLEYEMSAGGLFFAAAFILSLPALAPKNRAARLASGVIAALAAILFRTSTDYELSVCFASLLTTPLASWLDELFESIPKARRKEKSLKGGELDG